jgi:hypothetical protein
MHVLCAVASGIPLAVATADGGAHGATTLGMHGMGVSTPIAAAVAAATIGLAGLWHIAKGMMFIIGMISVMVAAGMVERVSGTPGSPCAVKTEGAMPIVHWSMAPVVRNFGTLASSQR